jgi:DNA primase
MSRVFYPSIVEVAKKEGLQVRKVGKNFMALCPFHPDRRPSLAFYVDSGRYHCFGCGSTGDAVDFIMRLKGLSFHKTLHYLGLKIRRSYRARNRLLQAKRLIEVFRRWEKNYFEFLAAEWRAIRKLQKRLRNMDEVEEFALLYHRLPLIEHKLEILLYGDDQSKWTLFEETNYGQFNI